MSGQLQEEAFDLVDVESVLGSGLGVLEAASHAVHQDPQTHLVER
jgi:hypothetical protein